MQSTQVQLWYWPIRGLAERIRVLMEYLGIKYENKTYEDRTEWLQKVKPTLNTAFPNLPYLKDGETIVTESEAIIVYLVLKAGKEELLGRNNQQKVDVAQVRGVFGDMHSQYVQAVYGDFQSKKEGTLKTIKDCLGKLSKFMGTKEYICGQITYVDFLLAEFFNVLDKLDADLVSQFENLKKLEDKIWNEPKIKDYTSSDRFKKVPLNGPSAKWNSE